MSIVLLIDGYNVIGPVAPPGRQPRAGRSNPLGHDEPPRWLAIERQRLLDRLAEHLDENVRLRTCVVFDAKDAPPNLPSRFEHQGIDVRFAVDYCEADDLLEELIAAHPAPKTLSVVSSDHRIGTAARRRRAGCFDAADWLDRLLDGHVQLIKVPKARKPKPSPSHTTGKPRPPERRRSPDPSDAQADTMISDETLDEWIRKYQ
ncbi:NYN domain-containing protein [Allorhodopirellula solitaria]|uniref:YacP-like NYN domain protein n=1 Tax=Allorhodopirellula solitaria TaxID=2527987 RepID=A0A5C5YBR7_9BACT|nr:NYN domain-containing protein [Allorhodopirellula solitaria]TWT73146.1 YacP-like NYN domain protein [Allorhodopirellula solitaria]